MPISFSDLIDIVRSSPQLQVLELIAVRRSSLARTVNSPLSSTYMSDLYTLVLSHADAALISEILRSIHADHLNTLQIRSDNAEGPHRTIILRQLSYAPPAGQSILQSTLGRLHDPSTEVNVLLNLRGSPVSIESIANGDLEELQVVIWGSLPPGSSAEWELGFLRVICDIQTPVRLVLYRDALETLTTHFPELMFYCSIRTLVLNETEDALPILKALSEPVVAENGAVKWMLPRLEEMTWRGRVSERLPDSRMVELDSMVTTMLTKRRAVAVTTSVSFVGNGGHWRYDETEGMFERIVS